MSKIQEVRQMVPCDERIIVAYDNGETVADMEFHEVKVVGIAPVWDGSEVDDSSLVTFPQICFWGDDERDNGLVGIAHLMPHGKVYCNALGWFNSLDDFKEVIKEFAATLRVTPEE